MRKQILILLSICCLLCGCGIKREANGQHAYLLNVERPEGLSKITTEDCLYIRTCRAANPYAGRNFVYRITSVQYEQDYYNQFLTTPDNQVNEIMTLWFRQSGIGSCLSTTDQKGKTWTLVPRIDVLCVDFQEAGSPKAVIKMHFEITRQDSTTHSPITIFKETYLAESPLPTTPSAPRITEAMSRSLTEILTQLEQDIAGLIKSK